VVKFPLERAVVRTATILDSLINPAAAILGLLIYGLGWMLFGFVGVTAESLAKDYRDDPVYKKNLQRLIERNRQFEKKE
jgi:hypothetical protein